MKIKFSPQVYLKKDIEYIYGEEQILAKVYKVTLDENNEEVDREIENTFYADFSKIEYGKIYPVNMPLSHAFRDESGELYIEVINYIGYEATEEESFPKEFVPSIEEFEIPEDAEIIQLEELINPESEPVVDQVAELLKANTKIDELETYVNQTKEENETLVLSAIEMMMEMMQIPT